MAPLIRFTPRQGIETDLERATMSQRTTVLEGATESTAGRNVRSSFFMPMVSGIVAGALVFGPVQGAEASPTKPKAPASELSDVSRRDSKAPARETILPGVLAAVWAIETLGPPALALGVGYITAKRVSEGEPIELPVPDVLKIFKGGNGENDEGNGGPRPPKFNKWTLLGAAGLAGVTTVYFYKTGEEPKCKGCSDVKRKTTRRDPNTVTLVTYQAGPSGSTRRIDRQCKDLFALSNGRMAIGSALESTADCSTLVSVGTLPRAITRSADRPGKKPLGILKIR